MKSTMKRAKFYGVLRAESKLLEDLRQRNISERYLRDEKIQELLQKGQEKIDAIYQGVLEQTIIRVKELEANKSKKETPESSVINSELRKNVKEKILQGESFEDLVKDKSLEITEEQMKRLEEEFSVIFLLVQCMPKREIAKRMLQREERETDEAYEARIEKAIKVYQTTESVNNIVEIRHQKVQKIAERLSKGESMADIVADKELNVCREAVEEMEAVLAKKMTMAQGNQLQGKKEEAKKKSAETEVPHSKAQEKATIVPKENPNESYKMHLMKEKYKSKYIGKDEKRSSTETEKDRISQDSKVIDNTISKIEDNLQMLQQAISQGKNSNYLIQQIGKNLTQIAALSFSIEQAQRLKALFYSDFLEENVDKKILLGRATLKMREYANSKLLRAIQSYANTIGDIDVLKSLLKEVPENKQKGLVGSETARATILQRIAKIENEKRMAKKHNTIPMALQEVLQDISSGKQQAEKTEAIIQKLVEERSEERTGKFRLTEEQHRKQIMIQIRNALREQAERYPIKDADKAIESLEEVSAGETGVNLNAVVDNLIGNRKFEDAKGFCTNYSNRTENKDLKRNMMDLKRKVMIAEIGDLVKVALNSTMTQEEENTFWKTLKDGIKKGNLPLSSIVIGKTQDNTRTITLADIWPEKQNSIQL